jgi:membrane associated rhomboid family serine protease
VGLGPNTRCYEHPDRLAGAVCRSCERPICADCMVQAPVGWHCRSCVRRNAKTSPVVRYRPGNNLPGFWQTPVTLSLIAINIIVYFVTASSPHVQFDGEEIGVLVYQGDWYRLLTSMFVHYSVEHIGLNMISLLIVGRWVEPVVGPWRYLGTYLVSGFGGSVAVYLFTNPLTPSAGASGAIFGLFGAYFVLARRASADTSGIVVLIGVNLAYSFAVAGVSWQAHIGGLVTGMAVAYVLSVARHRDKRIEVALSAGALVILCLVLSLLVVAVQPGQLT